MELHPLIKIINTYINYKLPYINELLNNTRTIFIMLEDMIFYDKYFRGNFYRDKCFKKTKLLYISKNYWSIGSYN